MNEKAPYYQIILLVPPILSLIYSISVQCFLSGWHECPWNAHIGSITLRVTVLVLFLAISLGLSTNPNNYKNDKNDITHHPSQAFMIPCILSTLIGIILIYRTRKIYITGPKPNILYHAKTSTAAAATAADKQRSKVIFITGANTGIGKETARLLLTSGATVIMACRSEQRAREAMEDILASSLKPKRKWTFPFTSESTSESTLESDKLTQSVPTARQRLLFLPCDVSDYDSVRKAVDIFHGWNLPLDVLINNAGIMMGTRKENKEGHELTMACNHLGHFLLTCLLLDKLRASEYGGRVIVVTSSTYVLAGDGGIDLEDLHCRQKRYTMFGQYAQSKLANILMGKELARREEERQQKYGSCNSSNRKDKVSPLPVAVHMVHPGLVRTDVVRNMPWYLKYPNMIFSMVLITLQKSPEAGAYTSVYCALDESLNGKSGEYFCNSQACPTNEHANNVEKAKLLWEKSCELVGLVQPVNSK
jgi:NAD(P)-dependent dehydrogenase (short-subunit alcohol dehydrogenase family)